MLRSDIPQVLLSSITEDDPYRAPKLLQIERWCYANRDFTGCHERDKFLAQVLCSEDCWEKVNTLHGVKLNRQMVGKKLITPPDSDNPFRTARYSIACRCCLEEDIIALFEERKKSLSAQGKSSLLEYCHLVRCFGDHALENFWSHIVSGYTSKLMLFGRHPYKCGLDCAMLLRQAEAVEFFWNKIKSLPEDELSTQQKDEIFMKTALRAALDFNYPEILEFCLSQINPDKYPEFLRKLPRISGLRDCFYTLENGCSFDTLKTLFDCSQPSSISEHDYYDLLRSIAVKHYLEYYANAGAELFIHIWMKEGFSNHRVSTLHEEMANLASMGMLLKPFVSKGYMEPVWAVLDKASPDQIKKFMDSRQADYIRSMLKEKGDKDSLNKFLSYGGSIIEELENPSANLSLSKAHKAKRPK